VNQELKQALEKYIGRLIVVFYYQQGHPEAVVAQLKEVNDESILLDGFYPIPYGGIQKIVVEEEVLYQKDERGAFI